MVKLFYIENRKKGNLLNIVDTWKDGETVKGLLGYSEENGFHVESNRGRMSIRVMLPNNFSDEAAAWLNSCIGEEFMVKCNSFEESNYTIERVQDES